MAAVVAATALKGRGARNARVLRGKERDPGEGRAAGGPPFFHILPGNWRRSGLSIPARTPLQDLKESGGYKVVSRGHPVRPSAVGLHSISGVLLREGVPRKPFRLPRSRCFTLTAVQRREP